MAVWILCIDGWTAPQEIELLEGLVLRPVLYRTNCGPSSFDRKYCIVNETG